MEPYRVIQWATGRLGQAAINAMVGRPDMKLVGGWVHSPEKDGKDLGELAGIAPIGVKASNDRDAVLALDADCVCYMPGRMWTVDPMPTVAELASILRSGKSVANAAWPALLNPEGLDQGIYETLHRACMEGGSTFYTSGIDPGYGNLNLALAAMGLSSEVNHVHAYEIGDYSGFSNDAITKMMGFGQPDIEKVPFFVPGYVTRLFGSTVRLIGKAMGIEVEELVEGNDVILASEAYDVACGHIAKGTISSMRFSLSGIVAGRKRITVEHVTRLQDGDFAEVDFNGHGYRVVVDGEPGLKLDLDISSPNGDPVHGAFVATCMAVVNATPQVCAAPPGILTALDLKHQTSKKQTP